MKAMQGTLLLLAMVCGSAAAAGKPVDIWLQGSVHVDAQGDVTHLDWDDVTPTHKLIAERITPKVMAWKFQPASLDGTPVTTQTGLAVHLKAAADDGALNLRVVSASTGPMALHPTPPAYPREALFRGDGGLVVAEVLVAADGSPTVKSLTFDPTGHASPAAREALLDSSAKAVKSWAYAPEVVGGKTVPTVVRVPIVFCIDPCGVRKLDTKDTRKDPLPANMYIGESSQLALATQVEGSDI